MKRWKKIGWGALLVGGAGATFAYLTYSGGMGEAEDAYARLLANARPPTESFNPEQVAHLPEIAQRYFRHAIAPGTPLYSGVELEMEGTFLLGDKANYQSYTMSAHQAIRPPHQFVWMPHLRSGILAITGSDALVGEEAWTRFWIAGLVPVADLRTSPDMIRSARFRGAIEGALWLPTTLLPENGVRWEQVGPNEARVTLERLDPALAFDLKLSKSGAVTEVVGQRWSNANPDKRYRLQPFGGTMTAETSFNGLTIPTTIMAGNHFGTEDYLPFFQARITRARFF